MENDQMDLYEATLTVRVRSDNKALVEELMSYLSTLVDGDGYFDTEGEWWHGPPVIEEQGTMLPELFAASVRRIDGE